MPSDSTVHVHDGGLDGRTAIRFISMLAFFGLLSWCAHTLLGRPATGVDDADITFVYSSHLANGHGLVYNIGGERVEGFTSGLWMLLCALPIRFGIQVDIAARAMCLALVALTSTVLTFRLDSLGRAPHAYAPSLLSIAYVLLLAAYPPYVVWMTLTEMDVTLWGTLVALAVVGALDGASSRWRRRLFALIPLLVLARPEALLLGPVIIAARYATERVAGTGTRTAMKHTAALAAVFAAVAAAVTFARLTYFGFPFPNTYYAKVSPSALYNATTGVQYLWRFLSSSSLIAGCLAVVSIGAWFEGWKSIRLRGDAAGSIALQVKPMPDSTLQLLLAAMCGVLLLIPAINGGDHFGWSRFYQPVVPLLVFAALVTARHFRVAPDSIPVSGAEPRMETIGTVAIVAFLAFVCAPQDVSWANIVRTGRSAISREFEISATGRATGAVFSDLFRDLSHPPSVGVITAGGFKFAYGGEVVDLMGLNLIAMGHSPGDRVGAKNHAAFDKDVFFALKPDIVLPRLAARPLPELETSMGSWTSDVLRGMDRDSPFRAQYTFAWLRRSDSDEKRWAGAYVRKDFLDELGRGERFEVLR